jgi:hypothetical protein
MAHKIIKVKFIIISILMLSNIDLSFGMGAVNTMEEKRLYIYSTKELLYFLKEIGYSEFPIRNYFNISRNSNGTELRFIDVYGDKKKALVVSCDGSVKEIEIPSNDVWLNDEYQPLAWYDYKTGRVYYKNGTSEKPPFMVDKRADPSGIYFMKRKSTINKDKTNSTTIYSINAPQVPLLELQDIIGERIFSKNNKVFIFGNISEERDQQTYLYIFERKGNDLIQLQKVTIHRPRKSPAPFILEDVCSWEDEALFADTHDMGRSDLYVFSLRTHELRKIGKEPFGGGWGFYLQCDILKNVTEAQKKKKDRAQ